jgi:hypothetical protein
MIDEVGCHVRHAPATARGTESPPLAGERDEPVVTTGVAVDAQEAMGQNAALEIGTNFALDEASDGSARRSGAREERFEFLAHHAMEQGLFWLVTFVTNREGFAGAELESTRPRNRYAGCGVEGRGGPPSTFNARFEPAPRV